ncbi:uncharacterized protein LOC129582578 [Paramacrobiotus metropolitanus]|uniref:uncharacterized protein LOC129582578 n=1 Tax=Paramacrobiotus metropolitanus TaxID=2943436 RepID=UPI0024457559|nr:uncharacterized protein LOC129582578 [Paramacrobiotus metropolitanus]
MNDTVDTHQRPLSNSLRTHRIGESLSTLQTSDFNDNANRISIPAEVINAKHLEFSNASTAENEKRLPSAPHSGDTPGDAPRKGHTDEPVTLIKYAIHTSPLHHGYVGKQHHDNPEHIIQPALQPPSVAPPPLPSQTVSAHYPSSSAERPSDSLISNLGTASHLDLPPSELTVEKNEPYWTNEDLNEEDRAKAIKWAAGVLDNQHNDFLPEMVMRTGFQIKLYHLWFPLDIAVDQRNHRFTFTYAENLLQLWQKKPIAHRVDINEIMTEKPQSRKHTYPPEERRDRLHFSKRRLNLIRTDGQGKYHLMAPSREFRDKLLDAIFLIHHPASSTSL